MRALVEKCSEGNYSRGDWEVNTTPRNESKPPRDRLLERRTAAAPGTHGMDPLDATAPPIEARSMH